MTDPNAEQDVPPAKPPRPTQNTSTARSQLESDELYARQLAEHYSRRAPRSGWDGQYERPRSGSGNSEERDYSFFDGMLNLLFATANHRGC